jgi:Transposase
MKRWRFSEQQVLRVLRQAEAGVPVADLCRKLAISEVTAAPASMHERFGLRAFWR